MNKKESPVQITGQLLSAVFSDASQFCGREDVIHAIIHYQLTQTGTSPVRIAREHKTCDVVVFSSNVNGDFANTDCQPLVAIEVKGGAYGTRNALADRIDKSGYCDDMTKLQPLAARGVECWFICVDMPELGRAVSAKKVELVAEQCQNHGLCFAYYCLGEDHYYVLRQREKLTTMPVPQRKTSAAVGSLDYLFSKSHPSFLNFVNNCRSISGSEANITSSLYNSLRGAGFNVNQLSLETYFSFAAAEGSRMQKRPDIVVFKEDFDGRFNLYKGGDNRVSNDPHKLKHIDTIFEIKGGAAIDKKADKAILEAYLDDIQKLQYWRDKATKTCPGTKVRAVFLAVDGRADGLSNAFLEKLIISSVALNVALIYVGKTTVYVRGAS